MKIVVLDAKPLDVGDVSWDGLSALGQVTFYDQTKPSETQDRIKDANIVLTNKVQLRKEHINAAPTLQYVGVLATGYDVVDVVSCRDKNITVANVPGYSTPSTAQATIALLLELTQHIGLHAQAVLDGEWKDAGTFSYWKKPLVELESRTMVIVGYGAIGQRVGAIAQAMGMQIVAVSRDGAHDDQNVKRAPLSEALKMADVVSLHCPISRGAPPLIGQEQLALMKNDALLINTARGRLVDVEAVHQALGTGKLGGYATDVLEEEPPGENHILFGAPNCIVTPHLAWATLESRQRLIQMTIDNVRAFISGTPRHVVN